MYIACGTQLDIAFSINTCAQYMQAPGSSHFKAAKHILRYLKAQHEKITYSKQAPEMANRLYDFVDEDHAGSADDCKSVGRAYAQQWCYQLVSPKDQGCSCFIFQKQVVQCHEHLWMWSSSCQEATQGDQMAVDGPDCIV
jgi:hypothetical protein